MAQNRQAALVIGIVAALFLLSIICCSGVIICGSLFDTETEPAPEEMIESREGREANGDPTEDGPSAAREQGKSNF